MTMEYHFELGEQITRPLMQEIKKIKEDRNFYKELSNGLQLACDELREKAEKWDNGNISYLRTRNEELEQENKQLKEKLKIYGVHQLDEYIKLKDIVQKAKVFFEHNHTLPRERFNKEILGEKKPIYETRSAPKKVRPDD